MIRRVTGHEIIWLGRPGSTDPALAGAKAARLAQLVAAGFPVPEGFVVTTEGFARYAGDDRALADCLVPALAAAAAELGDVPLAVRSSSSAEDLDDASYAGMYETVLGVRGGAEALAQAVRRCWASASAARVQAYHGDPTPEDPEASRGRALPPMAVLVQRLVPARAAGVAFTANPVTGDRSETLVSAVRGLGDRLVSGEASPDEWTVRDGQATCRRRVEGAIDAEQASAVAELARTVERHFDSPQDVEWALAGDEISLLQTRPITALPDAQIPVPIHVPEGFWEREASHYPEPLSPFMRAIEIPAQNAAFRRAFAEFGVLLEGLEFREIGGWMYQRAVPLGGKDSKAPPWWLLGLLARIVPELRRRIEVCRDAVREDRAGTNLERWFRQWRPRFAARIREARAVDPRALSDEALAHEVEARMQLVADGIDTHVLLAMSMLQLGELLLTARELLGWDPAKTMALFAGCSETSTEPAERLAELARAAAERPAVAATVRSAGATLADVRAADPAFAQALDAYTVEFGGRALRYDVADSTLAEEPAILLGLLRDQLARTFDAPGTKAALISTREEALADARAALASRSEQQRDRFERELRRAERYYPTREDNEFFTISAPLALLRYATLELGCRLAERNGIASAGDVFFLEPHEALAALREGADRRDLVRTRQREHAWIKANPGPPRYGSDPGPPPDFRGLPREARRTMEALVAVIGFVFESEDSQRRQAPGRKLTGIAASPGRYRGTVRVLQSEHELAKLEPGDVLVCPITSPVWSVVFPNVGALVTDTGGLLSHPAIIAREYRVPAVVATGNATELLADGQVVTVDGTAGTVELEE
jgi:phosphohistidine swiveling domain-containing protein